uniref:Uncharacterized protein n=1 Tax=Picea glauca TaxID=3330 RepID=A0A117NI47_PICGL|nr:hypothetical protein ABT39_MTgene3951 [Picea glauca]QHR91065.1 hypothetical protein Q903MT_gene5097 [Picea sitchensis]
MLFKLVLPPLLLLLLLVVLERKLPLPLRPMPTLVLKPRGHLLVTGKMVH